MSGVQLWGYDSTNSKWLPVLVNSDGKLIIDPSEILEDDPTDDETGKAPTSNWAYDHEHDTDLHGAGEGHITILPWNYNSIGQGTWALAAELNQWAAFQFYNSSQADGDNISYKAYLAKGTYTLRIFLLTTLGAGILDVDIDAAEVASFDTYSAATTYNVSKSQTGITISASGLKTIRLRVDGKNPSASHYIIYPSLISLWRTA